MRFSSIKPVKSSMLELSVEELMILCAIRAVQSDVIHITLYLNMPHRVVSSYLFPYENPHYYSWNKENGFRLTELGQERVRPVCLIFQADGQVKLGLVQPVVNRFIARGKLFSTDIRTGTKPTFVPKVHRWQPNYFTPCGRHIRKNLTVNTGYYLNEGVTCKVCLGSNRPVFAIFDDEWNGQSDGFPKAERPRE